MKPFRSGSGAARRDNGTRFRDRLKLVSSHVQAIARRTQVRPAAAAAPPIAVQPKHVCQPTSASLIGTATTREAPPIPKNRALLWSTPNRPTPRPTATRIYPTSLLPLFFSAQPKLTMSIKSTSPMPIATSGLDMSKYGVEYYLKGVSECSLVFVESSHGSKSSRDRGSVRPASDPPLSVPTPSSHPRRNPSSHPHRLSPAASAAACKFPTPPPHRSNEFLASQLPTSARSHHSSLLSTSRLPSVPRATQHSRRRVVS